MASAVAAAEAVGAALRAAGASMATNNARVTHSDACGLGLRAARKIFAGETVLELPPQAWVPFSSPYAASTAVKVAPDVVQRVQEHAAVLREHGVGNAHKVVPAALLLGLHIHVGMSKAISPAGARAQALAPAYLRFLHGAEVDPVAMWAADELGELQVSPEAAAAAVRRTFDEQLHEAVFAGSRASLSVDALRWSQCLILSRAASVDEEFASPTPGQAGDDLAVLTFLPFLDLLNHRVEQVRPGGAPPLLSDVGDDERAAWVVEAMHDSAAGTPAGRSQRYHWDQSPLPGACRLSVGLPQHSGAAVVEALVDTDAGDELFISYGDGLGNGALMRKYGFAVPDNPNNTASLDVDWDHVISRLGGQKDAVDAALARSALGPTSVEQLPGVLHLRATQPLTQELIALIRCAAATAEQPVLDAREPLDATREGSVLHVIHNQCAAQLDRYSTTLEEDSSLLKDLPSAVTPGDEADGSVDVEARHQRRRRRAAAVTLRAGEKRILHDVSIGALALRRRLASAGM